MAERRSIASVASELNADYAVYVGRIAAAWSAAELHINLMIWSLAEIAPALGACITSQIIPFDGRMKALLSLLKLRRVPQRIIDSANTLWSDARGLQELRNRIIHDSWLWDSSGDKVYQVELVAPSKLKFSVKSVELRELRNTHAKINELVGRAAKLKLDLYDTLPTLPEIPASELHPISDPLRGR